MKETQLTADMLNSISVPKYGIFDGIKDTGQIWCVNPSIGEWLDSEKPAPVLPPVVILSTGRVEAVCEVAPLHTFRESAASTDLYCCDDDGEFKDFTIALWAKKTMLEEHLFKKSRTDLSVRTVNRMKKMTGGNRDSELRLCSGPVLEKNFDSRTDFRRWFLQQADILSVPFRASINARD